VDQTLINISEADTGYYSLLATDALGCTDQKAIRVRVNPNPVSDFHGIDTMTVPNGYILDAGEGMASYLWSTGDHSQSIEIDMEGWYWVRIISNAGCPGLDSIYIIINGELPEECLFIPNAFTPDNDGLNDTFKPVARCPITDYRMYIFNRWGEFLFESDDISIGWDGKKHGRSLPGDTYVYKITYRTVSTTGMDQLEVATGTVLLLK
jgi:gliding motility-associated-like protein